MLELSEKLSRLETSFLQYTHDIMFLLFKGLIWHYEWHGAEDFQNLKTPEKWWSTFHITYEQWKIYNFLKLNKILPRLWISNTRQNNKTFVQKPSHFQPDWENFFYTFPHFFVYFTMLADTEEQNALTR